MVLKEVFALLLVLKYGKTKIVPRAGCRLEDYNPCPKRFHFLFNYHKAVCVQVKPNKKIFYDKVNHCEENDGRLLEIWTEEIQQRLREFLRSQTGGTYWIGLRYFTEQNGYRWLSNIDTKPRFTHFIDRREADKVDNTCVLVNRTSGFWDRRDCYEYHPSICELRDRWKFADRPGFPRITIYPDMEPNMVTEDNPMRVTCTVEVGAIDVLSIIVVINENNTLTFSAGDRYLQSSLTLKKINGKCKRYMEIELNAPGDELHPGDRIRYLCVVHEIGTPPVVNENDTETYFKRDVLIIESLLPKLEAMYHQTPNIVFLGREFQLTCRSCIGFLGSVTWYLLKKDGIAVPFSTTNSKITVKGEMKVCGNYLISTIETKVTSEMHLGRIRCSLNDVYHHETESYRPRSLDSMYLVAESGPGVPELYVDFHEMPNYAVAGKTLKASCSACVGTSGDIYWSLFDSRYFKTRNLAVQYGLREVKREEVGARKEDPNCNRRIRSEISLMISKDLNGAYLLCRSSNETLPGIKTKVKSLIFHVLEPSFFDYSILHEGWPWIVLILLALFLAVLLKKLLLEDLEGERLRLLLEDIEGERLRRARILAARYNVAPRRVRPVEKRPMRRLSRIPSTDVDTGQLPTAMELSERYVIPLDEANRRLILMKKMQREQYWIQKLQKVLPLSKHKKRLLRKRYYRNALAREKLKEPNNNITINARKPRPKRPKNAITTEEAFILDQSQASSVVDAKDGEFKDTRLFRALSTVLEWWGQNDRFQQKLMHEGSVIEEEEIDTVYRLSQKQRRSAIWSLKSLLALLLGEDRDSFTQTTDGIV